MRRLAEHVNRRVGSECVYHDGTTWARARLVDVRTDAWGVHARVEVLPAAGATAGSASGFEVSGSWDFLRVWPTHWTLPWASWVLVFDPEAVAGFVALAAASVGRSEGERLRAYDGWLMDLVAVWAGTAPAGEDAAG
jgi:hypothetical protein